MPLPLLGGG
ncbi:hypothetical protein vcoNHCC006C_001138A, partial [Vibrio cholerae O1 str. NHCC-006C]